MSDTSPLALSPFRKKEIKNISNQLAIAFACEVCVLSLLMLRWSQHSS
jgi:hypothetical protein